MTYPELVTIIEEKLKLEFVNNPAFKKVKINNLYVEYDKKLARLKYVSITIHLKSTTTVKFWKSLPIIENIIQAEVTKINVRLHQFRIITFISSNVKRNTVRTLNYIEKETIEEWFFNLYELGQISLDSNNCLKIILNNHEIPTLLNYLIKIGFENDLVVSLKMKNVIELLFHTHLKGTGNDYTVIKDDFELKINKMYFTNRIRQEKLDELIAGF